MLDFYNAETISGLRQRVNILGVIASFLSRARFNKHYTLFRLRREIGGGGRGRKGYFFSIHKSPFRDTKIRLDMIKSSRDSGMLLRP